MSIIYTYGYAGPLTAETLTAFLQNNDGVLFDVRFSPFARNQEFAGYNLKKALKERYVHVKEWGNVNYKSGGPIQLQNFDAGLALLKQCQAKTVVIMCACKKIDGCHRGVIAGLLRDLGIPSQELLAAINPEPPPAPPVDQLALF